MNQIETEFEEDSFDDEFEPESEREIERRCPKPKPMPFRGSGQARHLAATLQKRLNLTHESLRQPPSADDDRALVPIASGSSASTTSRASSTNASANSSSAKRTTTGGTSSAEAYVSTLLSPRHLKELAAFSLLTAANERIQKLEAPSHLYPILLSEAVRLRHEDAIVHLVATWRLPVLNLGHIDIALEEFLIRFPDETSPCIADFIVAGLLYRRKKYCQLQTIVLPKDTRIGSDIFGHFARVPYHYCSRIRQMKLHQYLAAGRMKEGPKYLREVQKISTNQETNFYAYTKDNVRVVIVVPIGVIHWIGRKANISDVHAGLILQKYSPFTFHIENIALINYVDTEAAGLILDLVPNPENVRKIFMKIKRIVRPDHVTHLMTALSVTLRRFAGLRGFFTKINSMIGYGPHDNYQLKEDFPDKVAEVIRSWPQLTRLNLNDQPLDLPGAIPAIINPVIGGLTKLSLVRCKMSADDVRALASSQHVNTLQLLRLDYNDFKECVDEIYDLLSRLKAIQVLRMQTCHIKYRNCMRCAEALAHSQTLRIWNFTDNVLFKLRHIKEFVELCANIASLRAIGCRPLDFKVLLGKVAVPTNRGLSESKKRQLDEFGESLNLLIF